MFNLTSTFAVRRLVQRRVAQAGQAGGVGAGARADTYQAAPGNAPKRPRGPPQPTRQAPPAASCQWMRGLVRQAPPITTQRAASSSSASSPPPQKAAAPTVKRVLQQARQHVGGTGKQATPQGADQAASKDLALRCDAVHPWRKDAPVRLEKTKGSAKGLDVVGRR